MAFPRNKLKQRKLLDAEHGRPHQWPHHDAQKNNNKNKQEVIHTDEEKQ